MCVRANFSTKIMESNNRTPRARGNLWWGHVNVEIRRKFDGYRDKWLMRGYQSESNFKWLRKGVFVCRGLLTLLAHRPCLPMDAWFSHHDESEFHQCGGLLNHSAVDHAIAINFMGTEIGKRGIFECMILATSTPHCSGSVSSPNLKNGHFWTSMTNLPIHSFTVGRVEGGCWPWSPCRPRLPRTHWR